MMNELRGEKHSHAYRLFFPDVAVAKRMKKRLGGAHRQRNVKGKEK